MVKRNRRAHTKNTVIRNKMDILTILNSVCVSITQDKDISSNTHLELD